MRWQDNSIHRSPLRLCHAAFRQPHPGQAASFCGLTDQRGPASTLLPAQAGNRRSDALPWRLLLALLLVPIFGTVSAATISGTVTRASNGVPQQGVVVTALRVSAPFGVLIPTSTLTNAQGGYQFTDLEPGLHYVEANAENTDLVRQLYPAGACPSATCNQSTSAPGVTILDLSANPQLTGIDFALVQGGAIHGQVRRADNQAAVAGVAITLIGGGWSTQSASDGTFHFTRVPPGNAWLSTARSGELVPTLHPAIACYDETCIFDTIDAPALVLGSGMILNDRDIEMPVGARIVGTLAPIAASANQTLYFDLLHSHGGGGPTRRSIVAGADGSYAIEGLSPGDYRVAVSSPLFRGQVYPAIDCDGDCNAEIHNGTQLVTALGQTVAAVDFQLARAARVEGVVTDASTLAPLAGVEVAAYRWQTFFPFPPAAVILSQTVTAADGSYLLEGISPQQVRIATRNLLGYRDERFDNQQCPASGCYTNDGSEWALDWGDLMPANFALDPGASMFGRAHFPTLELPVSPVVEVYDLQGQRVTGVLVSADTNWQYHTTGLAPGAYRMRAIATFLGAIGAGQVYGGESCGAGSAAQCDIGTGAIVNVTTGSPVEVNFEFDAMFANGFE